MFASLFDPNSTPLASLLSVRYSLDKARKMLATECTLRNTLSNCTEAVGRVRIGLVSPVLSGVSANGTDLVRLLHYVSLGRTSLRWRYKSSVFEQLVDERDSDFNAGLLAVDMSASDRSDGFNAAERRLCRSLQSEALAIT